VNLADQLSRRSVYFCDECPFITHASTTAAEHRLATGGHEITRDVLFAQTRGRGTRLEAAWSTRWRRRSIDS
jgi:hypothetical protein